MQHPKVIDLDYHRNMSRSVKKNSRQTADYINRSLLALSTFFSVQTMAQVDTTRQQPLPTAGQVRYGTGLGRLLTSESERTKFDNARFNIVTEEVNAAQEKPVIRLPQKYHIDGITERPERPAGLRTNVWLDGNPYAEADLPQGLSFVRNQAGEVIGMNSIVSKGKVEFAKIGDDITRPQTAEEAQAIEAAALAAKKPLVTP